MKKLFSWIIERLQLIKMTKDFGRLCKEHDYQLDKIAMQIANHPRAKAMSRSRSGFIIKTENRGIIELRGTDNIIEEMNEEMNINPQFQKEAK